MRILLNISFAFLIISCTKNKLGDEKKSYLENTAEFEIQVNEIEEREFWDLFEVVDAVELKLTQDFFISDIYRLKIHEKNILVFDGALENLIRFDDRGNALNRIGTLGNGPEELAQIADFSINQQGTLYLASGVAMKISKFDLENQFQGEIKLKDQMDQISTSHEKIVASLTYYNNLNKNLAVFHESGDTLKSFFPFSKDVFPIMLKNISGHLTTNYAGNIIFNEAASSKIFEIDNEFKIYPKFHFLSDSELWPEKDRHQLNPYFEKLATAELTFLTRFYEESEEYLSFALNKKQSGFKKYVVDPRLGFFDKKKNKAFMTKKSDFLIHLKGPLVIEKDIIYMTVPKFELTKIISQYLEWASVKDLFSNDYLISEDYDSPIILKLKIRN